VKNADVAGCWLGVSTLF